MDMVNNANSAATSSPSQTQVVVPMASAQFSSPSVELTTSSPPAHVVQMASPQPRHPSRHILENKREYLEKCIPLYKLALRGDWNAARRMIDADTSLLNAAITKEWGTLLHVVAGTDQVHFVDLLVKLLNPDDLELKNFNGNTAFCYAAASGNLQIASLMIKKNAGLPKIRGGEGATPFYMAALQGKDDMARHLYDLTTGILEEDEWTTLFFLCIKNGLYDIALKMLQEHSMLALERDENNDTALHLLARMPSGFTGHGQWYPPSQILNNSMKPTPFVQLVECLWNKLLEQDYDETEMRTFISVPSQITFDATQVGNFQFVAALMRSYPDLLWEVDDKNRSIIHIAVIHRHSSIYSLIHELGSFKDFIATFEDDEGNNILHYAAKLTPPDKLGLISGAALQMTHELLWFKEVKELMLLLDVEKKNAKGKTPREIFAEEHKELLTKAESWTKSTSISCMLVSTLITAGVFTATFMLPGGIHKKTQTPNFLHKPQQSHLSNPHSLQGPNHATNSQQAYAIRLAKERHLQQQQQRYLQHQQQQQLAASSALSPHAQAQSQLPVSSTLQNSSQAQPQNSSQQVSLSPVTPTSPLTPLSSQHQQQQKHHLPHGFSRNTSASALPNQAAKQRQRQPQQRQYPQPGRQHPNQPQHAQSQQQAKLLKGLGRGNMLIHQNNAVDPSHLNGLSVPPGSQTVEKVDQIMPIMQGQNLYPGSSNPNQPSKPLVPAHPSNHSLLQQKLPSGPANTTLKQLQPVVSPSDNSIQGHVLSVTAGHMTSPPQPTVASNHHQLPLQSQPPYKQSNQTQSNVQRMLQQNCQVQSESSSMSQSDSPKVDQNPSNSASQVSTNTAMSPGCMDAASVTVVPPSASSQWKTSESPSDSNVPNPVTQASSLGSTPIGNSAGNELPTISQGLGPQQLSTSLPSRAHNSGVQWQQQPLALQKQTSSQPIQSQQSCQHSEHQQQQQEQEQHTQPGKSSLLIHPPNSKVE